MRYFLILFTSFLTACSQSDSGNGRLATPQDYTLPLGQQIALDDENIITYQRLVAESRCPVNTNCFWEGEATVELKLAGDINKVFQLTTPSSQHPNDVVKTIGNYRIELKEVSPLPGEAVTQNEIVISVQGQE